ncbi:MAG: tyrosine--tRNA ligase [Clostridia bacterium]|nr:tyrosine--tRNA ligase [Clostridia bacterium]
MNVLDILEERGFIAQTTFKEDLHKRLESESMTFYVGFDPTADSLHVGHFIPVMAMTHLQRAGHRPIALGGGGTAMVGDPSGKTDLRQMLTQETIMRNMEAIKQQLARFLDFSDGKALMLNNGDWLLKLNYVEFLRDIGSVFSVNRMLAAECYKQRMEKGLTFLEFNYMVMQGYDFLHLFEQHGCRLQLGGDDQWSNILAGADLIRRKKNEDAFALTWKLITMSDGKKMGKTEKGALWLDPNRTSPYEFYQYWRNIPDSDVGKFLALLTFMPMDEVRRLGSLKDQAINEAKQILAYEVTSLIHGSEAASKAQEASQALFGGNTLSENTPSYQWPLSVFLEDNRLTTLLMLCGLCSSKSEARKMVQCGAVFLGDDKVLDPDTRVTEDDLERGDMVLRKGKKSFCRIRLLK